MSLRPHLYVLPLLCGLIASAQETKPAPAGVVRLDVVVSPKNGPPVGGLEQKDFTILDNKVARPITSFRALDGSQEPVEVIVLIDSVNTTAVTIAYERGQVDKFLRENGGHLAHPTTLGILKDSGIEMQRGFTSDGNAIASAFDAATIGLRTIPRSTGFYGAQERITISTRALGQLATFGQSQPGRKMILWVSPGWPLLPGTQGNLTDDQSKGIFDQIALMSSMLRQSRTTLYAINPLGQDEALINTFDYENFLKGVTKPNEANIGNLGLQVLAVQSGGLAVTGTDIAALMDRSVADAKVYYELSFDAAPAERKHAYRKVEVQVDRPGLTARTSSGYYAEP